jgi:hypothetical protein
LRKNDLWIGLHLTMHTEGEPARSWAPQSSGTSVSGL